MSRRNIRVVCDVVESERKDFSYKHPLNGQKGHKGRLLGNNCYVILKTKWKDNPLLVTGTNQRQLPAESGG